MERLSMLGCAAGALMVLAGCGSSTKSSGAKIDDDGGSGDGS